MEFKVLPGGSRADRSRGLDGFPDQTLKLLNQGNFPGNRVGVGNMKRSGNIAALLLAMVFSFMLAGCGGGGGSDAVSTNTPPSSSNPPPGSGNPPPGGGDGEPGSITVVGPIDGFGSVFVNGIEFETGSASYKVDDNAAFDDSALSVGMVVTVRGSVNDDGLTGSADSISYDDELEGIVENLAIDPVDGAVKNFTVFGIQVAARDGATVFKSEDAVAFDWSTLANGDHVEISGNFSGDLLVATFIKLEDGQDEDFEAKGTVSLYNGDDQFTLTLAGGSTLSITVAPGAMRPSAGIADGQFVEVEGALTAPGALLATKVELEDGDDFSDDDGHVKIEGILSHDGAGTWRIRSTVIGFDAGTLYQPSTLAAAIADGSADGLYVEVEGSYVDGTLVADKVEQEDGDIDARGRIFSITEDTENGTHLVVLEFTPADGRVSVLVTNDTMFMNDDSLAPFHVSDLRSGMFINAEGYLDSTAETLVASRIEQEDGSRYEIEAPLGNFEDGASITALGVTFFVNGDTEYKDTKPAAGDFVRIRDDNLDGTADRVEIKD